MNQVAGYHVLKSVDGLTNWALLTSSPINNATFFLDTAPNVVGPNYYMIRAIRLQVSLCCGTFWNPSQVQPFYSLAVDIHSKIFNQGVFVTGVYGGKV